MAYDNDLLADDPAVGKAANTISVMIRKLRNSLIERLNDKIVVDAEADPWVLQDGFAGVRTGVETIVSGLDFIWSPSSGAALTSIFTTSDGILTNTIATDGATMAPESLYGFAVLPTSIFPGCVITKVEAIGRFVGIHNTAFAVVNSCGFVIATGASAAVAGTSLTFTGSLSAQSSADLTVTVLADKIYVLEAYCINSVGAAEMQLIGMRITYDIPGAA